jgi:DNA-binding GntR family transcriptional regulator
MQNMTPLRNDIRHDQMRHGVASVIRNLILARKVIPGEILRISLIAQQLGVSITPVREALLLLTQDGWLAHEPNRGFVVLRTQRSDIEDVYLMWGLAEGAQAARAAQLATAADLDTMRRIDGELHDVRDLRKCRPGGVSGCP